MVTQLVSGAPVIQIQVFTWESSGVLLKPFLSIITVTGMEWILLSGCPLIHELLFIDRTRLISTCKGKSRMQQTLGDRKQMAKWRWVRQGQ